MTGSFVQWLLLTPTFVGISAIKNCGTRTCPTPTLHNDGHALTVGLKTTTQTTALTRPFVTARNALDHQIAEHPELQYAVTLTTGSAPEMHALFNTSALHVRVPILASPVLTGDQPPKTSEANLRQRQPLIFERDQAPYRPLLTFRQPSIQPVLPLEYTHAFGNEASEHSSCTEALAHPHTKLLQHSLCSKGLGNLQTAANTNRLEHTSCAKGLEHSCTPDTTTLERTPSEHSCTTAFHTEAPHPPLNVCTNTPKLLHSHAKHLPWQLQYLISARHLNSKPRTPINLHVLQKELL